MRRKGIALISVLLLGLVLFIMVVSLLVSARGGLFTSQAALNDTAALYVAEAGVAEAIEMLNADPTWPGGTVPMASVPGSYTIEFNDTAPFTELQSVNNMGNAARADSYRGDESVPPDSVLLVVRAEVNGVERILEVILSGGGGPLQPDDAIHTSGKIVLRGNVDVGGIKSMSDPTPVEGSVHSNLDTADPSLIRWIPDGGAAHITGTVSSSGSDGLAVDMPGAVIDGGTQTDVAQKPVPAINIVSTISSKSSGNPSVPSPGTVVASGDYYESGDLEYFGDLQLDGANLYITGNLTVHGSITGTGQVYVGGDTHFRGDSQIKAHDSLNIALLSHGSVHLEGFDGTKFLDETLTGADAGYWAEMKSAFQGFNSDLDAMDDATLEFELRDDGVIEEWRGVLGSSTVVTPGYTPEVSDRVITAVANLPAGPTRDFLVERLTAVRNMFLPSSSDAAQAGLFGDGGDTYAMLDAVGDSSSWAYLGQLRRAIDQVEYDKLGASSFQGLVYSNGFIHVSNEVSVRGALITNNDGSQPSAVIDGETIEPGDLYITNGCDVTYVEDMFQDAGGASTSGPLAVKHWMGR